MRSGVLIGIIAAATVTSGCGQTHAEDGGANVQRSYQVGPFERIEVAGPFDVDVRTGSAPSVTASGSEKLIERLVVEVRGNELRIHTRRKGGLFGWTRSSGPARIAVTVPMLSAATLAGSGGISVDRVSGESFEGAVAGSGDLNVESLEVEALELSIAGSGDVRARSGQARRAEYNIAGSGDIDARDIRSETASVSIAGSGNVNGQATSAADVTIMGSGDVNLTGGAKCNVSKMGSGDARCS